MATRFDRPDQGLFRIGIDGRYVQDRFPGVGRYTYNLLRALTTCVAESEFLVLYNPSLPNTRHDVEALGALSNVRMIESVTSPLSPTDQWRLPSMLLRLAPDVFHTPHFLKPYQLRCPSVATVHDLIPVKYPASLPSLHQRFVFRVALWLTCRASHAILAPSETSRRDLIEFCSLPPGKVRVVPYGADERFQPQSTREIERVRRKYGLPNRYVLHVGGNKPHKNLGRLVEAWAHVHGRAREHHPPRMQLVMASRQDPRFPEANNRARALGLDASILFVGDVAERDLPGLYAGAALFIFPSLYEGFGLPVLEAMACGTPVICSNVSALPEVTGDAAILVDPKDIAALAEAIASVLGNARLSERLRDQGLSRAKAFSWGITAAITHHVYRKVTGH